MVNPFLIITAVVMSIIIMASVILLIVVFGHPDDAQTAYFPKAVTALGLWLAFASVMILPYDVAAKGIVGGSGVEVDTLWLICYMTMAVFIGIIIPYAFFFYESDMDPEDAKEKGCCNRQAMTAAKYTLGFFIIFFIILIIMYTQLRTVTVPVVRHAQSASLVLSLDDPRPTYEDKGFAFCGIPPDQIGLPSTVNTALLCSLDEYNWEINVTFPVYVIGFLSFIGWFFFTLFAGVGLIALPMDLINEFRTRPTPMEASAYFEEKRRLGERASMLLNVGEKIKSDVRKPRSRKDKTTDRKHFREFEKHYYFLKQDYQILHVAHKLKGGNPLVPFLKLVLGILGIGISFSWLIHICVFILPPQPAHQFLNIFFIKLTDVASGQFPLFGVIAYAFWSLYLLWAVVKGNFKLGVRFVFWKIYPMEVNNTLMNAFLANTWVIILTAIPTVQFCARAFPVYARETSVDMLFGTQVQNLKFFEYFWRNNVFIYVIVILNGLTLIWLLISPNDKAAEIDRILDKMTNADPKEIARTTL